MDCQWKEWQDWSACPRVCGVSTKSRHREKIENVCGGRPCQGMASENKTCDSWAEDIALIDHLRDENQRLKKEQMCNGVNCKNGGSCREGVCQCLEGFIGERCQIDTRPGGFKNLVL